MTIADDITRELTQADTAVEATTGREGMRRYALEAGTRICAIPAVRAARIDSAELSNTELLPSSSRMRRISD